MKTKSFVWSLLALVLILCTVLTPALAYFTANDRADGAIPVTLGSKTEIQEEVTGLKKEVTIQNTEGKPVWVRAIAYAPANIPVTVSGWGVTGGTAGVWYEYGKPLKSKSEDPNNYTTTPLTVEASGLKVVEIDGKQYIQTSDEFLVEDFNISVQYESTPVLYDEDGNTLPPDWDMVLDVNTTTGTSQP
jgi:hypothetical protein